ncbi:hypothetical protein ACFPH8_14555 [Bizionia hallyeonensis]|uniref:Collagen triple helix repeat-containing protein n=1 Tax=Bizionia hallyeonensis TaxID=1123757 RepID=A0ABW0CA48_9FLAO
MKTHVTTIKSIFFKSKLVLAAVLITFSFSCSPEDGTDGADGAQGIQGEQGPQGEQGESGSANASKYVITVADTDWDGSYHYGGNNSHTVYSIPASLTGNIGISDPDYVVIAYGRPTGTNYGEKKHLPYVFGVDNNYGLKFELLLSRNELSMSKTTNGWNNSSVPMAERPDSFILEIFMIEMSAANKAKIDIDFNDYHAVVDYFELDN